MKRELFFQKAVLGLLSNPEFSNDLKSYPSLGCSNIIKAAKVLTEAVERETPGIFGKPKKKLPTSQFKALAEMANQNQKENKLYFKDLI